LRVGSFSISFLSSNIFKWIGLRLDFLGGLDEVGNIDRFFGVEFLLPAASVREHSVHPAKIVETKAGPGRVCPPEGRLPAWRQQGRRLWPPHARYGDARAKVEPWVVQDMTSLRCPVLMADDGHPLSKHVSAGNQKSRLATLTVDHPDNRKVKRQRPTVTQVELDDRCSIPLFRDETDGQNLRCTRRRSRPWCWRCGGFNRSGTARESQDEQRTYKKAGSRRRRGHQPQMADAHRRERHVEHPLGR
jgi:hypothetical protein